MNERPPIVASLGCLILFVLLGGIGFNALFCHAGYVDEMDGSLMRMVIGGVLGLTFGLLVILED